MIANDARLPNKLDGLALDTIFRTARTANAWTDRAVTEQQLRELYDLMKFGPTSANCCPARFVWVTSSEGKAKLAALAAPGNAPKIVAAPARSSLAMISTLASNCQSCFPPAASRCRSTTPILSWRKPPHFGTAAFRAPT